MADIFISYTSSDRPRAESLRRWFEHCGWSVWIDREVDIGECWEERIESELNAARLVVVLWSANARHSDWVVREAQVARQDGRLLQIHATGLPLLAPFDQIQAVRMQAWSGETAHSERNKLLETIAQRLNTPFRPLPPEPITSINHNLVDALQISFYYCARQVENRCRARDGQPQDFSEIRTSFDGLLACLQSDPSLAKDDREGFLHRMVEDFLNQLESLVPDPGRIK
jgi:hypothetical protein